MYIMSKLWQKSASKVLGLVSNSPPPLENVQIQGEKSASNNLDLDCTPYQLFQNQY